MTLEIQVLAWDRHHNVAGLNTFWKIKCKFWLHFFLRSREIDYYYGQTKY